jgi:uncharacterized membrane protein YozB (DUF420 family)
MSTGIFGTRASLVADINLLLQIAILGMLAVGVIQARRGKLNAHHSLMTMAVIVNAAAIAFIMDPSFFRVLPFALRNPLARGPAMLWPHVLIGGLAELMGAYIVIRTKTEPSAVANWPNMKRMMVLTLLLWIVALAVGIVLYFVWYT